MQPGPQFFWISALCALSTNLYWIGLLPSPGQEPDLSAGAALAASEAAEAASEAAAAAGRAEAASGAAGSSCEGAAARLDALEARFEELAKLLRALDARVPPAAPDPAPPGGTWAALSAGLAALAGTCAIEAVRTIFTCCVLPVPCPCRRQDGGRGSTGPGSSGRRPGEVLPHGRPARRGGGVVR